MSFIDKILDNESVISFITEIELQVWNPPNPKDLEVYEIFVDNSLVIGIDDDIIREAIRIRKSYKLKLPDAIIAATAIAGNLTLIADNDKDYTRIPNLVYINPQRIHPK